MSTPESDAFLAMYKLISPHSVAWYIGEKKNVTRFLVYITL